MDSFLPHKPPIRIIKEAVWMGDNICAACLSVPAESPYLIEGIMCPEMYLEIMAQCFAFACGKKYGSKDGYLAGIRDFTARSHVFAGEKLLVRCEVEGNMGEIWLVNGKVWRNEVLEKNIIAEAELRIYIPEDTRCV